MSSYDIKGKGRLIIDGEDAGPVFYDIEVRNTGHAIEADGSIEATAALLAQIAAGRAEAKIKRADLDHEITILLPRYALGDTSAFVVVSGDPGPPNR